MKYITCILIFILTCTCFAFGQTKQEKTYKYSDWYTQVKTLDQEGTFAEFGLWCLQHGYVPIYDIEEVDLEEFIELENLFKLSSQGV
mgnify:CR=1 FL=1